tara:strand:- start:1624 stop:1977 length:354 start_codon:yes stop_codon:yes gene_type:complete
MEIVKLIALLVEWGPVGVLAGMLFFLIREQARQHRDNIKSLKDAQMEAMSKLTETIIVQSELVDEVKSVVKISRKEAFEHRRKFEDYVLATTSQHTKLETVLDIVKDNTSNNVGNRR